MEYTSPLPPDLDQEFQGMWLANGSLVFSRQYDRAKTGFEKLYRMLLDKQPVKSRYHKGHVLHQIGIILVLSGNPSKALRYFILAYIEDLLNVEPEEDDKADNAPAGRVLRGVYKVNEAALTHLKDIVRKKKSSGSVIRNPESVFAELAQGKSATEVTRPTSTLDLALEKRKPGQFEFDWENRVFVGGDYSTHFAEINDIKTTCQKMGYEPVIASDFETPPGMEHHHALMLLHECNRAIFEASSNAGQLMEIERLRDYGYSSDRVLIVFQPHGHPTGMLEPLLKAQRYQIHRYQNSAELIERVKEFLA